MQVYQTNVSQFEITKPIYIGYIVNEQPVVVSGGIQGSVHIGSIAGTRPDIGQAKVLEPSAFGVVEIYRMWIPYAIGADNYIYNGPLSKRIALAGQEDWAIIEAVDITLANEIAGMNTPENNLPMVFSTEYEAFEFIKENPELAAKYTEHYKAALQVEHREVRVGFDPDGKQTKPTPEQVEEARIAAEKSGLQMPDTPVKVQVEDGTITAAPDIP